MKLIVANRSITRQIIFLFATMHIMSSMLLTASFQLIPSGSMACDRLFYFNLVAPQGRFVSKTKLWNIFYAYTIQFIYPTFLFSSFFFTAIKIRLAVYNFLSQVLVTDCSRSVKDPACLNVLNL